MNNTVPWTNQDLINGLDFFLEIYNQRPIKNNTGGGLSVNLFDVWNVLRFLEPKYVIENGVFQGQSTWLVEKVLPNTKIAALDPLPQQRVYTSSNAYYLTQDFDEVNSELLSPDKENDTLVYFDDHHNQYQRIIQANKLGLKHLLFDDNHPEYRGQRHLTLGACLNEASDPGYIIPDNAKQTLEDLIETYYIFPPIFRWNEPVSMEKSMIEEEPLLDEYVSKYETYYNDMHNYRWTTYVRLK